MSAHLDIYDVVHDHPQAKQELENYDNVVVAALALIELCSTPGRGRSIAKFEALNEALRAGGWLE